MSISSGARAELLRICGDEGVFDDPTHRRVYDGDGYTLDRVAPEAVVLPRSADQVRQVVRWCASHQIPFVARGAGTGLSGGCLPLGGGIQIGLARLDRILEIDPISRTARVEPGVVNLELSRAAAEFGLGFAPDPSSQAACTLGGNFAGNSGGPHTLKYGVTLPHVLGLSLITPEGERIELGGAHEAGPGIDHVGINVGAEGTTGIAVELLLRLTPLPQDVRTFLLVFDSIADAAATVSALVASGVVPAAMELIDRMVLRAVEAAFGLGLPEDAGAVLLIELDGPGAGLFREEARLREVVAQQRCRELKLATGERERAALWRARKNAFGSIGRLSPNYATQDGVVPRAKVPDICAAIDRIAARHDVPVGVVLHAGDGNIHPALLYDERDPLSVSNALAACGEILECCIELGGSPTGEHGVGMEKREFLPMIFGEDDLDAMKSLKAAYDPATLCNPLKVLPTPGGCIELRVAGRQVPA